MPYSVRLMRKEDVPQVNEIDREVFPTQWPPPNYHHELGNLLARYIVACEETEIPEKPEAKTPPETTSQGLAHRVRNRLGRFFGLEKLPPDRQPLIGFAGIWVLSDEAHITNIAARKRYQHRGIGELLLISIIDLAKEMKANIMTLEVRASNTVAQNLYRKYGFTQVGLRRGYYTDNREDGILMSTESFNSTSFKAQFQRLRQAHARKWGASNYELAKSHPAQPGK
ncbi:ribosomal protein S18-alanine N-acetyltransferase [Chloroflexota bacterium]